MSKQQKMFKDREERLKNEILALVEERDRRAVAEIEKQNQYLVEQIKSMKSEVRQAQQTITEEAKALALADFNALRGKISELEAELTQFDASDEARAVINGYKEKLERINEIGEEKLAQFVAHAHTASEDMHQKLDAIDGIPDRINSQLDSMHSHVAKQVEVSMQRAIKDIHRHTRKMNNRANRSDREIKEAASKVRGSLFEMEQTVKRVNNMGDQVFRKVFGWWFVITMVTAFFLGIYGWLTANYFFG